MIADRGYDSNWFRAALKKRGTEPCIPSTRSRKTPLPYDKALYRTRHKIENFSPISRIGGESQHARAVAPTPSSPQSESRPPSRSPKPPAPLRLRHSRDKISLFSTHVSRSAVLSPCPPRRLSNLLFMTNYPAVIRANSNASRRTDMGASMGSLRSTANARAKRSTASA
jgi:hypothetical protein